jgi:hypothetical protein
VGNAQGSAVEVGRNDEGGARDEGEEREEHRCRQRAASPWRDEGNQRRGGDGGRLDKAYEAFMRRWRAEYIALVLW